MLVCRETDTLTVGAVLCRSALKCQTFCRDSAQARLCISHLLHLRFVLHMLTLHDENVSTRWYLIL